MIRRLESPAINLHAEATTLSALGAAEAASALAAVAGDEQRDVARADRRAALADEQRALAAQLEALADEAATRLVAGLAGAGAQITASSMELDQALRSPGALVPAGAQQGQALVAAAARDPRGPIAHITRAVGEGAKATTTTLAEASARDGKRAEFELSRARRAAEEARDAERDARALRDRALGHVEAIARARVDASLAGSR